MNIKDIGWIREELCLECPDAPMETCKCGCMKKAIINAIEYLKSENANLRGNLVAAQKVIEAERKPPADLFADLSDDDKRKAEMLAIRDMVALCEQRLARAAEERDSALEQLKEYSTIGPMEYFRDLAEADREGRIYIRGKVFRCPKCGSYSLTPRVDNKFYYCYHCKIQLTSEEVEAILEGRKSK